MSDVAAASVDTDRAGLTCPAIQAQTDGPVQLTLLEVAPGTPVMEGTTLVTTASASGQATVALATGTTNIQVCATSASVGTVTTATNPDSADATGSGNGIQGAGQGVTGQLAASGSPVDVEFAAGLGLIFIGAAITAFTTEERRTRQHTRRSRR
jgi:hypothetical protein